MDFATPGLRNKTRKQQSGLPDKLSIPLNAGRNTGSFTSNLMKSTNSSEVDLASWINYKVTKGAFTELVTTENLNSALDTYFANGIITLGGPIITTGIDSPEGMVTAEVGSLYLRIDGGAGTTLYVKETGSGDTGWVGK